MFFVSTLGSTIGTLGTSFWLILWWELNHILYGMLAISFALSLATLAGSRAR
ncbi:MAG: hypothetical protein ACK5OR_06115 [Betaproteobacteria bacterium]